MGQPRSHVTVRWVLVQRIVVLMVLVVWVMLVGMTVMVGYHRLMILQYARGERVWMVSLCLTTSVTLLHRPCPQKQHRHQHHLVRQYHLHL